MSSETREGRLDFLREAEERARRERTSVKAALAADRERLRTLPYPGPDCLDPEEIEQLSGVAARTPVWAEARLGHVEGCEDCATLLLMSEPGAVSLERMIAAVRVRIAEEPAPAAISRVREGRNRREPAWEALLGLGPLTLVLAVLWAWGTIRPDGLPGRVVSVMGWAAGVSVLVTLAAVGAAPPRFVHAVSPAGSAPGLRHGFERSCRRILRPLPQDLVGGGRRRDKSPGPRAGGGRGAWAPSLPLTHEPVESPPAATLVLLSRAARARSVAARRRRGSGRTLAQRGQESGQLT